LLLAGLLACGRDGGDGGNGEGTDIEQAVPVGIEVVERRDFIVYGEYYGIAEPIIEARLIAEAGGRVTALSAEEGDRVRQGESLGRIDAAEAIARFERAQIAEEVAVRTWRLRQRQERRGTIAEVAVKEARLAYLDAKNTRLQAAKVRDGALCITPIRGLVVLRLVDLYDELAPGTPTFRVARLDTVQVAVRVPENDITRLEGGSAATVHFDAVPGDTFPGIVSRVARALSPETQTYKVIVRVYNRDERILSGLKARVRLAIQVLRERVAVPTDAIITEVDLHYVMLAVDTTARRRIVRIGPSDETRTVVTEGLEPGSRLIVAGQARVRDGTPLTIEGES
jgi:membrane fusion protein (multidrug efflux system)